MTDDNVLARDDRPRFFEVAEPAALGLAAPKPRRQVAVRTYARALAGMRKEAVIVSSATGRTPPEPQVRLSADEPG